MKKEWKRSFPPLPFKQKKMMITQYHSASRVISHGSGFHPYLPWPHPRWFQGSGSQVWGPYCQMKPHPHYPRWPTPHPPRPKEVSGSQDARISWKKKFKKELHALPHPQAPPTHARMLKGISSLLTGENDYQHRVREENGGWLLFGWMV